MQVLRSSYAYTEQIMCFSDIVILYMYITKYGCVFLKLVYTWQWISFPCILLGSLPLAHNAQHSLVILLGERERAHLVVQLGRAVCMYLCIYPVSVYRVPDTVNF